MTPAYMYLTWLHKSVDTLITFISHAVKPIGTEKY